MPFLMKYLSGQAMGRFPVWMMRQAGRYLPKYRAIRAKYSFWEMATQPEIAAEVSLLPMQEIPVDAIIFFSDILTMPFGLGLPITMKESVGPITEIPLRTEDQFKIFEGYDPSHHTRFVGEALSLIKKQIPNEMTLLGFAGAPWTVGSYLIEGQSNRNFEQIKSWMHSDPASLASCLQTLGDATVRYLEYQHYSKILDNMFLKLKEKGVPAIYFTKHSSHLTPLFSSLPVSGFSVDELVSLTELDKQFPRNVFFQGNLDPILLLKGTEGQVRLKTRLLVQEARGLQRNVIMNLAHGILPGTPVENARAFVQEARSLWI